MNVLVIGGSSDIGISLCKYLNNNGYNVISTYNNNFVNIDGIEYIKCDVRDEESILECFKYCINKMGNIDILINMAAVSMDNEFLPKSKSEFMNVLEVNLVGTFLTCQTFIKQFNNGLIINFGSTDGIDTYGLYNLDYSVSKSGVIMLSKYLSNVSNNKVVCICPNWIDSDTTRSMDSDYLDKELKRIGQSRLITVDEVNDLVYSVINRDIKSGSVIRLDVRDDKLWIEEM